MAFDEKSSSAICKSGISTKMKSIKKLQCPDFEKFQLSRLLSSPIPKLGNRPSGGKVYPRIALDIFIYLISHIG